ncbi:MAG: hypothetical protein HON65_01845, partial [Rhodospirillales bacterium]|nr:hypothetical protein [Rhodospirillales bacterium]
GTTVFETAPFDHSGISPRWGLFSAVQMVLSSHLAELRWFRWFFGFLVQAGSGLLKYPEIGAFIALTSKYQ